MSNSNKDQLHMYDLGASFPIAAAAFSGEDHVGLVKDLKNKLQNLVWQHSDAPKTLTPIVRKCVEVLREIQSEHDELEVKFFEEGAMLDFVFIGYGYFFVLQPWILGNKKKRVLWP